MGLFLQGGQVVTNDKKASLGCVMDKVLSLEESQAYEFEAILDRILRESSDQEQIQQVLTGQNPKD